MRIAFGSCHKVRSTADTWQQVLALRPDLWIWAGDNIYADTTDEREFRLKYQALLNLPDYMRLRAQVPILATWDDHDYGKNNAGAEFPAKQLSQRCFLDFLGVPADDPRRQRQGVYYAEDIGTGSQRIRVILLDCRYHREAPGPDADILGAQQWAWLERQLQQDAPRICLVVSGIQVLSHEHRWETWGQFPAARQRLLVLLDRSPSPNLLLISGDRHIGEISRTRLPGGRDLVDITTSGLTNPYRSFSGEPNRHRVGTVWSDRNCGLLLIDWDIGTIEARIVALDGDGLPPSVLLPLR